MCEAESGLSLVAVLRQTAVEPLVTGLHTQLFQAQKRVALALCGKGNIGSSWLKLFAEQKEELEKRHGMNFELVAVIDSQTYCFKPQGIDAAKVFAHYNDEAVPNDGQTWLTQLGNIQALTKWWCWMSPRVRNWRAVISISPSTACI